MCFRTRQNLIDSQNTIETFGGDPMFFIDKFLPDHGDLRNRSAPGKQAEPEETQEQSHIRFVWRCECIVFNDRHMFNFQNDVELLSYAIVSVCSNETR